MADGNTDADFKEMVCYFWTEKRDPTRWSGWDALRCQKLMPLFYEAWSKYEIYEDLTTLTVQEIQR